MSFNLYSIFIFVVNLHSKQYSIIRTLMSQLTVPCVPSLCWQTQPDFSFPPLREYVEEGTGNLSKQIKIKGQAKGQGGGKHVPKTFVVEK